jgi:hypothetical protein
VAGECGKFGKVKDCIADRRHPNGRVLVIVCFFQSFIINFSLTINVGSLLYSPRLRLRATQDARAFLRKTTDFDGVSDPGRF